MFAPVYPTAVIRSGDIDSSVVILRALLQRLNGLPVDSESPVFDDSTLNEVLSFQGAFGLSSDGIVGPFTWQQLIDQTSIKTGEYYGNLNDLYPLSGI